MEYFLLKSNVKVPFQLIFREKENYQYRLTEKRFFELPDSEISYFHDKEDIEIPELLTKPTFMVGDALKHVIELYDESVLWKSFFALPTEEEKALEKTKHYWIPNLKRVKCLHADCELQPNGAVTKLILDKRRLRNIDIFQVEEAQENLVLVSLALAESISRRHPYGVKLERIEVR